MKSVRITTIPHSEQRYETVGDYQERNNIIYITVSDMKNWKYEDVSDATLALSKWRS